MRKAYLDTKLRGVAVATIAALACGFGVTRAAEIVPWRSGVQMTGGKTLTEAVETLANTALRGGSDHVVVQFNEPVTPATKAKCKAAGLELQRYVGSNAYFAKVNAGDFDGERISAVSSFRDAWAVEREWKLHPDLLAEGVPAYARAKADGSGEEWVALYVMFHRDVDLAGKAVEVAESHGAVVRSSLESINTLVVEVPANEVDAFADEDAVQWIEPPLPVLEPNNAENRALTEADEVQAAPYNLDGTGINVLVYDGGTARSTHVDFQGRLTVHDGSGMADHPTHVAGTIGGGGVANANNKGMAPGTTLLSYGYEPDNGMVAGFLYTDPGDIEEDFYEAITTYGADISNASIGTNTAPNQFPCSWEGDYGATSVMVDTIVRGDSSNPLFSTPFRAVWANGNERNSGRCGTTYHTTAPPACSKNAIAVGAVNSNDDSITSFTSWGPADDGRLKPDISAPGCQSNGDGGVTSTVSTSDTAYDSYCGTSMAAPTVTGISALLLQDYRVQFPGEADPRNSTLKILLAHNAVDLGNPGPDYQSGYGSVRIRQTIDFMRTGSFTEGTVDAGEMSSAIVNVLPGEAELKITLAWDDVPGTPNVNPALINDLDLRVYSPSGVRAYPWTLGGLEDPSAAAVRTQEDRINNIEQVYVENPEAGVWRVEVYGYNVPEGPQPFSLCATPLLSVCSSAGSVSFASSLFGCEDTAEVFVVDCDLNTDDEVVDTVAITVESATEPAGETVVLTETSPASGNFAGSIPTSAVDAVGVLQVGPGDAILARYVDADDGQGGTNVETTAMSAIDCIGPIVSSVSVESVKADGATIVFQTDEPAIPTIRYGLSCDELTGVATTRAGLSTEHTVQLIGLSYDTRYFFQVEAVDNQGNLTIEDNSGACYTFTTPDVVYDFPMDFDPGWTTSGDWAFGQPTGGGSYNGDPTSGYTGDNVYGYNLVGDYSNNLSAAYLTTTALDCSGLANVQIGFRRWLGVESNSGYDEATVEVSNNGTSWTTVWSAIGTGSAVSDTGWQYVEYNISGIADNEPTVYVRWGMGPTDGGLTYPGWNIDDVRILAQGGVLSISIPSGLPTLVAPGEQVTLQIRIREGDEAYVDGTGLLYYVVNGAAPIALPLIHLSGDLYEVTLPAPSCGDTPEFYIAAEGTASGLVTLPANAPSQMFGYTIGALEEVLNDDFETDMGWTTTSAATDGDWMRGIPVNGDRGDPVSDFDGSGSCYVTDNVSGNSDVDSGTVTLTSPVLDMSDGGTISYAYWLNDVANGRLGSGDGLFVEIATDSAGTNWQQVRSYVAATNSWRTDEIDVVSAVGASSTVRIRFIAADVNEGNVVEAGVDAVLVELIACQIDATCSDGIQNQGEDRVDCGGPCPACECTDDAACDNGIACDGTEGCDVYGVCVDGAYACNADEWCEETGASPVCHVLGNGDFDADGDLDLADFAMFQVCYQQTGTGACAVFNMVGEDGLVDGADFAAFLSDLDSSGPQ